MTAPSPAAQRLVEPVVHADAAAQQAPLDLGERQARHPDEAGHPVSDHGTDPFGNAGNVDGLDLAIDHHQADRAAVAQMLRRHDDTDQDIAGAGIGLLERAGRGIDLRDADPPPLDARQQAPGRVHELREDALYGDAPDLDVQPLGPGRRANLRRPRQGDAAARAARGRTQGVGRDLLGATWAKATAGRTIGKTRARAAAERLRSKKPRRHSS